MTENLTERIVELLNEIKKYKYHDDDFDVLEYLLKIKRLKENERM